MPQVDYVYLVRFGRSTFVQHRAVSKVFFYESKDSERARFALDPSNKGAQHNSMSHQVS